MRARLCALMTAFLLISTAELAGAEDVPGEYGKVIYRHRGNGSGRLYIVALCHRSFITRRNGPETSRVQAEVYKIGEWLIKNKNVELLLPEGFFKTGKEEAPYASTAQPVSLEFDEAKALFDGDSDRISAETLLSGRFGLPTAQVEDRALYEEAAGLFRRITCAECDRYEYPFLASEFEFLQKIRTASMLQRIPEIIGGEMKQGRIKNGSAMFTIGLLHIADIVGYLNKKGISIPAPLFTSVSGRDYSAPVNLLREDYDITVIVPSTLAGKLHDSVAMRGEGD